MEKYYINRNAQSNGDHEVHDEGCRYLPSPENRKYLGAFSNCKGAVKEAEKDYSQVNGCKTCCNECHTQ